MRIGLDAKTLSKRYTGIGMYVKEIVRYFTLLDSEDEFFLYSNKPISLTFDLPDNFHIVYYKALTGTLGVISNLPYRLRKDKIDLFWGPEHCLPLGKQPFIRVVTIHDLAVQYNFKLGTRYNYLIQRFIGVPSMKCANAIIAISKATAKDVSEIVDRDKVVTIYNGDSPYNENKRIFDDISKKEILCKWNLEERKYFLFVGSIEPRKNLITLVRAFNLYKETAANDYKLVLAGGLGWRYNKILKEIRCSSFTNEIILTGYIAEHEKECLYKYATALTFPSVYEGLGLPIIEAMSLGIPVITSNISSMPEVGGECALYTNDIYNAPELAGLMEKASNYSLEERDQIAEKNMRQALKFSRKKCAEEILELFHFLYNSSK